MTLVAGPTLARDGLMAAYFGLVACCDLCQKPASRKLAAPIKCFLPSDGLLLPNLVKEGLPTV
jgi:hypothetical protein